MYSQESLEEGKPEKHKKYLKFLSCFPRMTEADY